VPGKIFPKVVRDKIADGEGRTYTGTGRKDCETGTLKQANVAGESKVLIMVRVAVESLKERCRREQFPSGSKYPVHLPHSGVGELHVFEDCFAVNRVNDPIRVRKLIAIGHHVDVREKANVDVDEGRMNPDWSPSHRDAERSIGESGKDRAEGFFRGGGPHVTHPAHDSLPGPPQPPAWRAGVFRNHAAFLQSKIMAGAFRIRKEKRHAVYKRIAGFSRDALQTIALKAERLPVTRANKLLPLQLKQERRARELAGIAGQHTRG
jgi:hypothetical protein